MVGTQRNQKKVLILMSDTGGGHRASAEAIKAAFNEEFGDEYQVSSTDCNRTVRFNYLGFVALFIDHVLCAKSVWHRYLLQICGRITPLGPSTNCPGAITSW